MADKSKLQNLGHTPSAHENDWNKYIWKPNTKPNTSTPPYAKEQANRVEQAYNANKPVQVPNYAKSQAEIAKQNALKAQQQQAEIAKAKKEMEARKAREERESAQKKISIERFNAEEEKRKALEAKRIAEEKKKQATTEKFQAGTDKTKQEEAIVKEKQADEAASDATKSTVDNENTADEAPENTKASEEKKYEEAPENTKKEKLSMDFLKDLGSGMPALLGMFNKGRNPLAAEYDNKEQIHLGQSQAHQKAEQEAAAISHRNVYDEAARVGRSQAAEESAQNVNNTGASAGAAVAASKRKKLVGDVQTEKARADAARKEAVENNEKRNDDLQAANETRASGKASDFKWRQRELNNSISDTLSMGKGAGGTSITKTTESTEEKPSETDNTEKEGPWFTPSSGGMPSNIPPNQPQQPTQQEETAEPGRANGQRVMNYLLGNRAGENPDNNEQALFNQISSKYNVKPVPIEQAQSYYPPNIYKDVNAWEGYYNSRDDEYGTAANKQKATHELREIRGEGDASKNLQAGHGNEQSGYAEIPASIIQGVTSDRM